MKAIQVSQFGGPEVLKLVDLASPVPAEGEVLIDVKAIGVNPVETYIRAGQYPALPTLPYIPGNEGAGLIADGPRRGERVIFGGKFKPDSGPYAQQIATAESQVWPLPDSLSFEQGAAVFVGYVTAWRAIFDVGESVPGQTILIHGASGGVGLAATQIAIAAGLTVFGTASSDAGLAAIRAAGARAYNHKTSGYLDQIKADSGGLDRIIEMLANVNLDRDLEVLKPLGRVIIIGSRGRVEIDPRKTMATQTTIHGMNLHSGGPAGVSRAMAAIVAGLRSGAMKPIVGETFRLDQAADAHEYVMQNGGVGKVVLTT